jgi:hypothetical protein
LHNVGARLSELPRLLEQVRQALDPALLPHIHAQTAVKQNTGVLSLLSNSSCRNRGCFRRPGRRSCKRREELYPEAVS